MEAPPKPMLEDPGETAWAPWDDAALADGKRTEQFKSSSASPTFQRLVNQLVQQHLRELNELRNRGVSTESNAQALCKECGDALVIKEQMVLEQGSIHSMHSIRADKLLGAFSREEFKMDKVQELDDTNLQSPHPDSSRLQRLQTFLQSDRYEMIIAIVLCINVLLMAIELQVSGTAKAFEEKIIGYTLVPLDEYSSWQTSFVTIDLIFTVFFAADVFTRILVLKIKFFKAWVNYIDLAVSVLTLLELSLYFMITLPVSPILFRLLRIGKLTRAIRMVTMHSVLQSLHLLIKCLTASANMLFWSFCLLTFFQCVSGLVISTLCKDFIQDSSKPLELRREVFLYYGTFTRTFLSMFEILFANWSPPCRILVDDISEWFSIFFLIYRCLLGFAVLNVVNAVFVQQTMKTASSDEELAFKQRQRDLELFTGKVKKLFKQVDESGDGSINKEEFAKLVKDPMLNFWLGQLELEYHDLMGLFEFLDNGDGEITLMEFLDGATRLRGGAKALDVWRIEMKVEMLFHEVLTILKQEYGPEIVNDVFRKANYEHLRAASRSLSHTKFAT